MKKIIIVFILCALIAVWGYVIFRYTAVSLFTCFIPLAIGFNVTKNKKVRNTFITVFVILWLGLFHYESIRHFYLQPAFQKALYKVKFLFPPAGWIMFFRVGEGFGYTEVYGVKDQKSQLIDPHSIFRTRTIMFDNIHRGILGSVADKTRAPQFCRFLRYRYPYFDSFFITVIYYPSMTKEPFKRFSEVRYQCVQ